MRLRLSDESWQWLRTADHYASQIQLVSVNGAQLSIADQYAALLRAAEVSYNHAALLRFKSEASADSRSYLDIVVPVLDSVPASDYSRFLFTRVVKDVATSSDKQMFTFTYLCKDVVTSSDKVAFDIDLGLIGELVASVDFSWAEFTTLQRSVSTPADTVRFDAISGLFDTSVAGSSQAFAMTFLFKSTAAVVDFVQCTFQAGLFDSVAGSDRVSVSITTLVRDSVTAASGFFLSGRAFQNMSSAVAATDVFYSTFTDPQPDTVGASDFIEIGIRYVIDFYFGGMSFGGSPFGGRTI